MTGKLTTGYGNGLSFITPTTSNTVTDIDGNVYQIVTIGSQVWMAENLKVTHYRNGDAISHISDSLSWANTTSGAYCNYDNNEGNVNTYGRLYNGYVVLDSRNIAPIGWHVPSDLEWQTLIDFLGSSIVAGGKMKEAGTSHWISPNTDATNESGFTALGAGSKGTYVGYVGMGISTNFWSSTEGNEGIYAGVWSLGLKRNSSNASLELRYKNEGNSIRCVKD